MFSLAELVVQITGNAQPLNQTLAGVKGALMGTVPGATEAGAAAGRGYALGFAGAVVGAAALVGAAVLKAVTMGSDLNETLNKTGVIFGDQAPIVTAAADEMAAKFGVVKTTFLDAGSAIGNMLEGMGDMSRKAAAEMSVELARAAADASSIFNTSFEESMEKIRAGLAGQSEPLLAFGVNVQESAVKLDAMAHGAKLVNGELTMQDKVAARARVILAGLAIAHGDLANTSAGFANSSRALFGRLQNAAASFGQAVMPIFEGLLGALNRVASGVAAWVESCKPQIEAFSAAFVDFAGYVAWGAGQVGEAIAAVGRDLAEGIASTDAYQTAVWALGKVWEWLKATATEVFEAIGVIFRNWRAIVGATAIRVRQWVINAGEAFWYLVDSASAMLGWFGANWTRLFADIFNGALTLVKNFVINVATNLQALWDGLLTGDFQFNWTPLLDGFKATIDQLPEIAAPVFTDLSREIDDAMAGVGEVEAKRLDAKAKAGAELARAGGGAAGERARGAGAAAKEKKDKTEVTDLAGFAKNLLQGDGKQKKAAEDTARNTGKMAAGIDKAVGALMTIAGKAGALAGEGIALAAGPD